MQDKCVIALDGGTGSTRAIVFSTKTFEPLFTAQLQLTQYYPSNGQVEHDCEEIWQQAQQVLDQAKDFANSSGLNIQSLGITNQRETVALWHKETGELLARAIVWQDRRTAKRCQQLREEGLAELIQNKTGLLIDPYFSATKIDWLLETTGSRDEATQGKVLAGTMDTYLIWRLTDGKSFVTDVTNASRTMLFSLADMAWDEELLKIHNIPLACLPEVKGCVADFGITKIFGKDTVIGGVAGDQQSAAIGQACINFGETKSTYGTGCFVISQAGSKPIIPKSGLLGTVGYQVGDKLSYAIEGSIFNAGSSFKWLRDKLTILDDVADSETIALQCKSSNGCYVVPAFTGLGAPHWDPDARGAIIGMTFDTGRAEIIRAFLESVAFQTMDLATAFANEGIEVSQLRIDGGMAANNLLMQMLADYLACPVARAKNQEATATGAAFLAALHVGVHSSLDDVTKIWQQDRVCQPTLGSKERESATAGWHRAVNSVLTRD